MKLEEQVVSLELAKKLLALVLSRSIIEEWRNIALDAKKLEIFPSFTKGGSTDGNPKSTKPTVSPVSSKGEVIGIISKVAKRFVQIGRKKEG